ncbi:MAG: hypothetical protein H6838_07555 [Planctomycetes bacterium]|nr:hypothetical protein [Planctomycetota bacterium]
MLRPLLALQFLLLAALPAQRHLLDTLPQEAEARELCGFAGRMEPYDLPGKGPIRGLTTIGSGARRVVWLLRGDELLRMAWPSLRLEYRVEVQPGWRGLCDDGRLLYTLGDGEVVVLDPVAGRPVQTRPLAAAPPRPSALGWHTGALFVASGRDVRRSDAPPTEADGQADAGVGSKFAAVLRPTRDPVQWLSGDGLQLWAASRAELRPIDADAAAIWAGGRWPVRFDGGAAVWIDGQLLLAAEYRDARQQPHVLCGLWAAAALPAAHGITVRVSRDASGQHWQVGETNCRSLRQLRAPLARCASDLRARVLAADGGQRLPPVVLEAGPRATVRELAETWDLVESVGFSEISSPAQEAWARDRIAWARKGLQPVVK